MRNILWLGSRLFADRLPECGWEQPVFYEHAFPGNMDLNDIIAHADFKPDLIVAVDISPAVLPYPERLQIPSVYYSTCSGRYSWQPSYAQAFDVCLVAQADHIPDFSGPFLESSRVWHLPLYAEYIHDSDQAHVRNNDIFLFCQEESGASLSFWNQLKKQTSLIQAAEKDAAAVCSRARITAHYSAAGELEPCVFEAMAAGTCLVTPRVGHGLEKIFVDGEHYVGYAPENAGDAAYRINFLKDNPELALYIGQTAMEEINLKHRAIHRARMFTDYICDLAMMDASSLIRSRLEKRVEIASYLAERVPAGV